MLVDSAELELVSASKARFSSAGDRNYGGLVALSRWMDTKPG
jgi:hypothetical protein